MYHTRTPESLMYSPSLLPDILGILDETRRNRPSVQQDFCNCRLRYIYLRAATLRVQYAPEAKIGKRSWTIDVQDRNSL